MIPSVLTAFDPCPESRRVICPSRGRFPLRHGCDGRDGGQGDMSATSAMRFFPVQPQTEDPGGIQDISQGSFEAFGKRRKEFVSRAQTKVAAQTDPTMSLVVKTPARGLGATPRPTRGTRVLPARPIYPPDLGGSCFFLSDASAFFRCSSIRNELDSNLDSSRSSFCPTEARSSVICSSRSLTFSCKCPSKLRSSWNCLRTSSAGSFIQIQNWIRPLPLPGFDALSIYRRFCILKSQSHL